VLKLLLGHFPPKTYLVSINNLGAHCISHLEDRKTLPILWSRLFQYFETEGIHPGGFLEKQVQR
jgi:hypothetical protein